jgi:hypothetical protein
LEHGFNSWLDSLLSYLHGYSLQDGADIKLLKITGKPYTTRDAYRALSGVQESLDVHGQCIWRVRVPNKVKIFAWLYFKDRLSTRVNLYAKHIVDGVQCQRCATSIEDRHHVFFSYPASLDLWMRIGLSNISSLSDIEIWNANIPLYWTLRFGCSFC